MFWTVVAGAVAALVLAAAIAVPRLPWILRHIARAFRRRPMSDSLAELYVSTRPTQPLDLLYPSLRSATGRPVIRPMGSAQPVRGFDDLALVPTELEDMGRAPRA